MQYGRFAVAAAGSEKSGQFDCPAEGCCLQPAGSFPHGQNSKFHLNQTLGTAFILCGAMLQPSLADRHARWRIAQAFALDQSSRDFDAVQP